MKNLVVFSLHFPYAYLYLFISYSIKTWDKDRIKVHKPKIHPSHKGCREEQNNPEEAVK